MIPYGTVLFICWIIYYAYWILASFTAKKSKEVAWEAGNIWWNVGVFIAFFLLRNVIPLFQPTDSTNIIALILVAAGLCISLIARLTLAGNWSGKVALQQNHTLVTSNVYTYVRHPIYTGFLLMGLGTVLFIGTLGILILYCVLAYFLVTKLSKEESLLLKHFPEEYELYMKRSKALIPFVW